MSDQKIQPALTPEEWAGALSGRRPDLWRADDAGDEHAPAGASDKASHAAAALYLHGQPFGFTWEDVDALRAATIDGMATVLPGGGTLVREDAEKAFNALADRIAALLPPREP